MTDQSIYLLEVGADTGAGVVTLRYASRGYVTKPGDTPANTHYEARLLNGGIGRIEQHMFGRGRTMGQAVMSLGDIRLANADDGLNALRSYIFDGQTARLLRLDSISSAYADAEIIYVAVIEELDWSDSDTPVLKFYDLRRLLDVPLLTERYAGTTTGGGQNTADGSPDIEGQIKPHVWGKVLNVEVTFANPYDVVLQVSDGAVNSITLYDGGVAITGDGDDGSISALIAASQNPGHYRTALTLGLLKPGGSVSGRPAFVWTTDVTEGATSALNRAGAVVTRILNHVGYSGATWLDEASFTTLDASATAEVGVFVNSEDSAISVIRKILGSVGAYLTVTAGGKFSVGQFVGVEASLGVLIASDNDIIGPFGAASNPDTEAGLPAARLRLRYGKYWRQHGSSDVGGCVATSDPERADALGREWREVSVENASIISDHPLAQDLEFETYIVSKADAEAERTRLNALYGVAREVVTVTVTREKAASATLGTSWTISPDRLSFSKDMVVIGRETDPNAETVTLVMWG